MSREAYEGMGCKRLLAEYVFGLFAHSSSTESTNVTILYVIIATAVRIAKF